MAAKKAASKETAKTTVQTSGKAAEEKTTVQTAEKKEEVKPAKVEAIETKAGKAKAIETKKDTTKAIETRAAVLQETKSEEEKVEKKTRTRKTSAKTTATKTPVTCELYLQFAGKEYSEKELMKKVKEVWTKELKHKVGELKDVKLYLKPEESAAYYVINKDTTGRIEL